MYDRITRAFAFAGVAALGLDAVAAEAAALNTADFLTACVEDPVVTEEPGLEPGGTSTPEIYCQCVTGKFVDHKVSQADVDLLTKLHNEELSDEEATDPGLDDLLIDNEVFEDECKKSLGLSLYDDTGAMMPEDNVAPMESEESPSEDSED